MKQIAIIGRRGRVEFLPLNAVQSPYTDGANTPRGTKKRIQKAYKRLRNWRAVGAELGITCGMAHRISRGYEPRTQEVRARLGLPALAPAPVCPIHGVVHVGRCPRRRVLRWRDLTTDELRWALVNRMPI